MHGFARARWLRRAAAHAFVAVALGLGGGLVAAPIDARAATLHTRFDFERPGYGGPGREITDHFLFESGGTWHLFYTELPGPVNATCRIGHARSTDLVHWTESPAVITAGGTGYRSTATWAPHVVANPSGGWLLFFTGRNDAGSQSIGVLTSSDLETWTESPLNPIWSPPSWARSGASLAVACRDPFVWTEGGVHRMLYTAHTLAGRPAIGMATSTNLLTWADAGPLVVDTTTMSAIEFESPHLVFDNGRVELLYSRFGLRILTANTSAGPWDPADEVVLEPGSGAPEKVRKGAVQLLSRVRHDDCNAPTSLVEIDTVTATPAGYDIPGPFQPAGFRTFGEAFDPSPIFADPPAARGETPVVPQGLYWAGSGESIREPGDPNVPCAAPSVPGRTGRLRSPRFTLLGDSLWYRVMGAASTDSAHLRVLDACTGLELARRTGPGTNTFAPGAISNAGRRGWPVHVELVDLLTRPGGVFGADAIRDSTIGTFTAPTPLAINQTAPAGGEWLAPGQSYVIRWTSFSSAGIDSHVVYVSYDDFATPPIRLQRRNANQFSWTWTLPAVIAFDVRIRVVAYAKNNVHDCDTSPPFQINYTTDVGPFDGTAGDGVTLAALANPGPSPVLAWSAPGGRRVRLELVDVRGRRVRTLVRDREVAAGGSERVAWDGRDEAGRSVRNGLYFATLEVEGAARRTVRLIRLAAP